MDPTHRFSPAQAASRTTLGAIAVVGPGNRRAKSKGPALRATVKQQLVSKCGRFLAACCPAELGSYWAAMLSDDAELAQRMLDTTARRMRRAGWNEMRQWKHQHGIAA